MGVPAAMYPARPPCFAHKFVRLMFRTCAAAEIGPDAVLMLVNIAHTEDAKRYTGPVRFFAGNLADQCGFSVSSMERARVKAVKAGWLHYEPGAKRKMASYWVTVPERFKDVPDGSTDDDILRQADGVFDRASDGKGILRQPDGASDRASGEHLTEHLKDLQPYPCPLPSIPSPASPASGESQTKTKKTRAKTDPETDPRFVRFWEAYPRHEKKRDAARVFAKLNPSSELLDTMLAAIETQKRSQKWADGYISHPTTWLNGRLWEDELPPATADRNAAGDRKPMAKTMSAADLDPDLYGPPRAGGAR